MIFRTYSPHEAHNKDKDKVQRASLTNNRPVFNEESSEMTVGGCFQSD